MLARYWILFSRQSPSCRAPRPHTRFGTGTVCDGQKKSHCRAPASRPHASPGLVEYGILRPSVHCKAWTCAAAELFHLVPAPSQGAKPGRLGLIGPELSWSCTCKDDRSPNVLSTSAMVTTTTSIAERHTHRVLFSTLQIGPVDLKQNCLTHNFTELAQQACKLDLRISFRGGRIHKQMILASTHTLERRPRTD